jgi:hypothetical protein
MLEQLVVCDGAMMSETTRERHPKPALLKRAYQLARSGVCKNPHEISRRLSTEGYSSIGVEGQLENAKVQADLARICQHAERM